MSSGKATETSEKAGVFPSLLRMSAPSPCPPGRAVYLCRRGSSRSMFVHLAKIHARIRNMHREWTSERRRGIARGAKLASG
eukprot:2465894-Pyramimonas_sp.AAC.1